MWCIHTMEYNSAFKRKEIKGFWGKESACQYRRHGFDPWSGKIPHASSNQACRPSYCTCALEPRSCNCWSPRAREPVLCNERSHRNEKPRHHTEEQTLLTTTTEKTLQQPRPSTAKNKYNYWKKKKRKEIMSRATTWMNLEDITLSKTRPSQRDKYCMTPRIWDRSSQMHRNRK